MARGRAARKRRTLKRAARNKGVETARLAVSAGDSPLLDKLAARQARRAAAAKTVTVSARRQQVRDSLVAAGVVETPLVSNFDLTRGSLCERWFVADALDNGYDEMDVDYWPTEAAAVGDDDRVCFRDGDHEAVLRLDDGTLCHVVVRHGAAQVRTAGPSREANALALASFRGLYPASYLVEQGDPRTPITFWSMSRYGPSPRLRKIETSPWETISQNYTTSIRDQIADLMAWAEPQSDGQLILWQGEPGTGKTWALRALASEWSKWAEFHYITDPDAFFVDEPSYMVDVLLADSYGAIDVEDGKVYEESDRGKWRVLILEDTGELLAASAKEKYGQGLSRLLNVVDGMIGQGLKVLAIVTTNDELGDLHPAAQRPGRCAAQLSFGALTADEASAWLGSDVTEPMTLAELFAAKGDEAPPDVFAASACANCDHAFADHEGSDGPCTVDGCDCTGYEAMAEAAHVEPAVELAKVLQQAGHLDLATDIAAANETIRLWLKDFTLTALATDIADTIPDEQQPGSRVVEANPSPDAPAATIPGPLAWSAIFAPEGKLTSDKRAFAPDSITWRQLPLTLMAMTETSEGGHVGAEISGRIDNIWRDEASGLIRGSGVFDSGEYGKKIAGLVDDKTLRGVSVDLAISDYQIGPRSQWFDDQGNWAPQEAPDETVDPYKDDTIAVVLAAEIGMVTVCPFPAFAEAQIAMGDSLVAGSNSAFWTVTQQGGFVVEPASQEALIASMLPTVIFEHVIEDGYDGDCIDCVTASAAGLVPEKPPAEWFLDPELDEPTALTIDDEGRIYGHAATWGVCHTGFPGSCKTAPRSASGYRYFHLGEVVCEEGERLPVGSITLDTGHADVGLRHPDATAHYDHTGTVAAHVCVGEDEYGIWVAGALQPDAPAEKVRLLRGAKLSGDWRKVDGEFELIALLAVNVPGFPVPRARALVSSIDGGQPEPVTLTAAGIMIFATETLITEAEQQRFTDLQSTFIRGELGDEFTDIADRAYDEMREQDE